MNLRHLLTTMVVTTGLALPAPLTDQNKENENYYRKWLMENVIYIITPEERDVFLKLQTDEERENFIEEFWHRRDPDPRTPQSEAKEEHYRRIAYANDKFTSGFPGWKTDRGMIYIKFGAPDRIESNPTGGDYQRPSREGGGSTTTYPFERWEYRYLAGVGQDIEIEFVDDTLSGEYGLTTNSHDKDAMLHVPNAGLTDAEMMGVVQQKLDRIVRITNPTRGHNPLAAGYGRSEDQPFEKLQLVTDLQKAPAIDFSKLKAHVEARVSYDEVPFEVRNDVFRVSEDTNRVIVTVYFKRTDISFRLQSGVYSARLDIYGVVKDLSGRVIREVADSLSIEIPDSRYSAREDLIYQNDLMLQPGRYKLELVVKDSVAEKLGSFETLLLIHGSKAKALSSSSILLARRIEIAPSPAARKRFEIWPISSNTVKLQGGKLGFYFEIYDYGIDQSTQKPDLELKYEVVSGEGKTYSIVPIFHSTEIGDMGVEVLSILPTQKLSPGPYSLKIAIKDLIADTDLSESVHFQLR